MANEKQVTKKQEEKTVVEFVPFGAQDKIRLTAAMVANFIAVPTKSGRLPNERDCIKFLILCRGKRANPFEGDCFLIGYDNYKDGKVVGATFSQVCGIDLFLKRAEASKDYDGNESGIIIDSVDGELIERKGAIVRKGETLIGGWAKVYRKNHTIPTYKTALFSTYNTGRSRWEKDPSGMIAKVALSQALREAYTTAIGGLYTIEEMQRVTELGNDTMQIKEPIPMPEPLPAPETDMPDPNSPEGKALAAELDSMAETK